jgi:hypothetical protein
MTAVAESAGSARAPMTSGIARLRDSRATVRPRGESFEQLSLGPATSKGIPF